MHVLFIPSWYPAQPDDMAGCFFREQALALQDHGMKVGVITPAFRSLTRWQAIARGGYNLEAERDSGIETLRFHGVRAFSWNHALNMAFWERTGLRAFDEYQRSHGRPDVLHVHAMIFGLAWAAAIHREQGIPFVVTEHSSEFLRSAIRPPLLAYLTKQITLAGRTFAVSSSLTEVLRSQVPLPVGRRWEVMHNMVSARFGIAAPRAPREGGSERPRMLLSVASLVLLKGHHHLLRALRLAIDAGADFHLRIAGSGPQELPLKQLTAELSLGNRVEFLGHCSRDQVALEMAAADAFVLPSSYETFGVVAAEALLSGCPVISTRCGGPEDIVVEGKDGYLVDKDDPNALCVGLLRLAREPGHFDPQDLRRRCIERFSETTFARRHADVYRNVLFCAKPAEAAS
jgi:glycosyltransferase involved in cell wall biosynthesis